MVSGRYFFPKAPVLCLKWMPAWAVTSVNSIGPEGRGGAALEQVLAACAEPELVAAGGSWLLAAAKQLSRMLEACCLQPANAR